MSASFEFGGLRPLRDFLRWLTQPRFAYRWTDEDQFLVEQSVRREGRREITEYRVQVHLKNAPETGAVQEVAFKMVRDDDKKMGSDLKRLANATGFTLTQLLQRFRLVRDNLPRRRSRRELLVAIYDVPLEKLSEIYASVEKNPRHGASITILDQASGRSGDAPDYLISLPMADGESHWSMWLESENQRLGGGDSKIQLFERLGEKFGTSYYAEYGFSHPLPEFYELNYVEGRGEGLVLIRGQDRKGRLATTWIRVQKGADDVEFQVVMDDQAPVDVAMDVDHFEKGPSVTEVANSGTLALSVQVEDMSDQHREGLQAVSARIRRTQQELFRLERHRTVLLDREHRQFFLLLRFKQRAAIGDEPAVLSENFQLFLLMTRRLYGDLQYESVVDEAGQSWHVLATMKSFNCSALPTSLADEVYLAPPHWRENMLNAYVREDAAVLPTIDDPSLAQALSATLSVRCGSAPTATHLLDKPSSDAPGMRVTTIPTPTGSPLLNQLQLLNEKHTQAEIQARAEGCAEMLQQIDNIQKQFEVRVGNLEREFKNAASERLHEIRKSWNDVSPEIDKVGVVFQACDVRLRALERVVEDAAMKWRDFIDRGIKLDQELTKEKIKMLKELQRKEAEWNRILGAVKQANINVAQKLGGLSVHKVCEEIEKLHAETVETYKKVAKRLVPKLEAAEKRCREIEALRSTVVEKTKYVRELDAKYEKDKKNIEAALAMIESLHSRIKANRASIENLLARVEKGRVECDKANVAFKESFDKLQAYRQAWEQAFKDGERMKADLSKEIKSAKELVDGHKAVQARQAADIDRLITHLRKIQAECEETADANTKAVGRLETQIKAVKDAKKKLEAMRQAVEAKKNDKKAQAEALREAATSLRDFLQQVVTDAQQDLESTVRKLEEVADALEQHGRVEAASTRIDKMLERAKASKPMAKSMLGLLGEQPGVAGLWNDLN